MQLQAAIFSSRFYLTLDLRDAYFNVDDSTVNDKSLLTPFRESYVEMSMPTGLYVHRAVERCRLHLRSFDTTSFIALAGKASAGSPSRLKAPFLARDLAPLSPSEPLCHNNFARQIHGSVSCVLGIFKFTDSIQVGLWSKSRP